METLPENTKQVMIISLLENRAITTLNLCKIELGLKEICGDIEKLVLLIAHLIPLPGSIPGAG